MASPTAPAIPTSMQVIRFDTFGGASVLQLRTIPVPRPGPGELLVKVEAAGVNPVDYKIRAGKYPAVKADKLPYTPGRDVTGTVVQRGESAQRFAQGEALIAMPGIERGGYAEYVIVKEVEAATRPAGLPSIAAGGVPLAALTAWQGLFKHGGLQAGQRVLIQGGAGGVGHFAVQFARAKGAHVATTVSTAHVEFARQLGAEQVIDYTQQRFEDQVHDVDLVFDLIGGATQERSWAVVKRGGALVSTLNEPSQERAAARGARGLRYTAQESGSDLADIGQLIEAGKVRVTITRTFTLAEAAKAQEFLEQQHPAGKVVLTVP